MKNKEAKSIFSSLENYSSIPPPELWDKIEAQLDKPKKKKRAIIWWSIAASLAIGFSVPAILYFNGNRGNGIELNVESNANGVVLQKNSNQGNDKIKDNSDQNDNDNLGSSPTAVTTVLNSLSKRKDSSKFNNFSSWRRKGKIQYTKNESELNAIVSNQSSTSVVSKSELSMEKAAQIGNSNSGVSNNNTTISGVNKPNGIAENTISNSTLMIDKSAQVNNSNSIAGNQNSNVSGSNSNKEIIESISTKDSLSKIQSEVKQLEKALVDKEKTKKKETPATIDKWSLQVFAGVMSSQNFNNEKVLGNTVASKQSGGYGVKTNYKLNKKWGLSSGFKISDLGQKIAGVSYYDNQKMDGSAASFVPISNNIYTSNPSSNYQLVSISNNSDYLFSSNSRSDAGLEKGDVTQNLKYFEMPVEVSYSLLSKKKTNISMNTGGFVGKLISNDIALNGTSIGENNNVNDFVYGTLLSSTLQYEFVKKTKLFIEPGMNYYINPLENQSFNQFQWMLNFGLNVSF